MLTVRCNGFPTPTSSPRTPHLHPNKQSLVYSARTPVFAPVKKTFHSLDIICKVKAMFHMPNHSMHIASQLMKLSNLKFTTARSFSGLIVGHDTSLASSRYTRLGEPCKSTREIGEPCSPVFKEAQPRPSSTQNTQDTQKHRSAHEDIQR